MNFKILLSIPKTFFFNFRYLKLKDAIKLPIWVEYNTNIRIDGRIIIKSQHTKLAMIRIGFHKVPVCNSNDQTMLQIKKGGELIFEGTAHIGKGSKIHIAQSAKCILGNNFAISASSAINCYKKIKLGENIQFSWDCLVMDSDTHSIYDKEDRVINCDKEIIIGNKVWIGCRTTILKGSIIPDNTIIGACSLVSGSNFKQNTIIAGSPAKSIKEIKRWEL